MLKINPVVMPQNQCIDLRQNSKIYVNDSISSELPCDTVCFKGNVPKKGFTNPFKKLFGITAAGTAGVAAAKIAADEIKNNAEVATDNWNQNSKGYKILTKAGFSNELIDKTINNMEQAEADTFKNGMNDIYIKNAERMIGGIFQGLNKDLQDDEKSAEMTFRMLSEIFQKSKDNNINIYGVYASVKFEGANVLENGTLSDGGRWGDNFTIYDKDGNSLAADRIRKTIDSDGNTIVEKVDCDGNVSNRSQKYDPNGRLVEEKDEYTRTEFHYDENGNLCEKVKHMAYATETLRLVNGEWKSDKEGGWKDW